MIILLADGADSCNDLDAQVTKLDEAVEESFPASDPVSVKKIT